MVEQVDVLICGSGSAGLCAATWLSIYGVRCKILEKRSGPMQMGQADGVQCRTVEVFESFGLSEDLLREAYHVLEVAFWSAGGEGGIKRATRTADTAPGLSHQPHVILNQARVNGLLIDVMRRFNGQEIDYGYDVRSIQVDTEAATNDPEARCVTVTTEKDGAEEVFQARYVLGCDGAHSTVRRSLGYKMVGDSSDAVWGVMDIYPRTNFPDIRKKATIHSKSGNLLIIPREGGSLVRFYIEMPGGTVAKEVTLEDLHNAAKRIFTQYSLEIADTAWWSAYAIGQRLADFFSKDNRVFLTGDACHTHSPKAGQGMNVSLQDGYNIGWKLGSILTNQARPDLLKSYNIEREKVAADLIDFDRFFTKLFSSKAQNGESKDGSSFSQQFIKSGQYTAGLTSKYDDSAITSSKTSEQLLASKILVGMRFPSAQVVRLCDANAMQFMKALKANGRWRIVIFAGRIDDAAMKNKINNLGKYLASEDGPVHTYTKQKADIDSFIEPLVILSGKRADIEQDDIHPFFWPETGKWKVKDLHKVFVDDESYNSGHGRAYEHYGVDPSRGAVVIVRPDQYVSKVTGVENFKAISEFFDGFAVKQK